MVAKQQGEARVTKVDAMPDDIITKTGERLPSGAWIISHSESGHHHVINGDVMVIERTDNVPAGMRILYAIVNEPTSLIQEAGSPHGAIPLEPGIHEFRISREYDPFAEQARMVAD